jgi:hypothetical protein
MPGSQHDLTSPYFANYAPMRWRDRSEKEGPVIPYPGQAQSPTPILKLYVNRYIAKSASRCGNTVWLIHRMFRHAAILTFMERVRCWSVRETGIESEIAGLSSQLLATSPDFSMR